jgi:hypothetical protein
MDVHAGAGGVGWLAGDEARDHVQFVAQAHQRLRQAACVIAQSTLERGILPRDQRDAHARPGLCLFFLFLLFLLCHLAQHLVDLVQTGGLGADDLDAVEDVAGLDLGVALLGHEVL